MTTETTTTRPAEKTAPPLASPVGGRRGPFAAVRSKWALALVIVLLLGGMQISSMLLPPFIFPGLDQIWAGFVEILSHQLPDIGVTLARFAVSLALSLAAGWAIGLAMGAFRKTVGEFFTPAFSIMQAVPALSWVLLAVLWISDVNLRIGFICFFISMPLIAIAVYEGIRNIDPEIVEAVDQFRPTKLQVLRMLLIPQSLVYLLMSVRSVSAFALRILVFAELIAASTGIGQQMQVAQTNFQLDMIFAWTLVLIIVNFGLVFLIDKTERRLLRWRGEAVIR